MSKGVSAPPAPPYLGRFSSEKRLTEPIAFCSLAGAFFRAKRNSSRCSGELSITSRSVLSTLGSSPCHKLSGTCEQEDPAPSGLSLLAAVLCSPGLATGTQPIRAGDGHWLPRWPQAFQLPESGLVTDTPMLPAL